MPPPMLDRFLNELKDILIPKDGDKLRDYLIIEPPFNDHYNAIIAELRQFYPSSTSHEHLEKKIESMIPEYDETGGSWPAFVNFLSQYFAFIRDVDASELHKTHGQIKSLVTHSVLALSDATMGIVVLPTIISLSKQLSRLSIGLEKLKQSANERATLVESSANTIREAFSKCLSERAAGGPNSIDAPGPPAGRRIGIYILANICLRLFFHARRLRSAEQLFGNIYAQSPPLARFPAAQRVTYLYYLGRYFFANSHFERARRALQEAYAQCHAKCLPQRRAILIQLISSNVILGRFPSTALLARPEAAGLAAVFSPICAAVKLGDLRGFGVATDLGSPAGAWLLRRRVLLQIRNRCEVLVWRSLARRVFLIAGFKGDGSSAAPRLDVEEFAAVARLLSTPSPSEPAADYVDPDFEDDDGDDDDDGAFDDGGDGDGDEGGGGGDAGPSYEDVEMALASLVEQGLLHGYMSHKHGKFVITGARARAAIDAGFPCVAATLEALADGEVPGWVTETMNGRPKAGGRVVNLTGARPVGVGA